MQFCVFVERNVKCQLVSGRGVLTWGFTITATPLSRIINIRYVFQPPANIFTLFPLRISSLSPVYFPVNAIFLGNFEPRRFWKRVRRHNYASFSRLLFSQYERRPFCLFILFLFYFTLYYKRFTIPPLLWFLYFLELCGNHFPQDGCAIGRAIRAPLDCLIWPIIYFTKCFEDR